MMTDLWLQSVIGWLWRDAEQLCLVASDWSDVRINKEVVQGR